MDKDKKVKLGIILSITGIVVAIISRFRLPFPRVIALLGIIVLGIGLILLIVQLVKNAKDKPPTIVAENESYFDGGFWHLVGLCIGGFLVCLITLGIAFPWVNCWFIRWRLNHTVVDGKRLQFNGSGGSLFGHFILRGWLLGIILGPLTLGLYFIYYFQVSLRKWEAKNTSFINS